MRKMAACAACNTELYEGKERASQGPLEGQIVKVGPVLEAGCVIRTYVMLSGTIMDWSFCTTCTPDTYSLSEVWKSQCQTQVRENDPVYALAVGQVPHDERQAKIAYGFMLKWVNDLPIGIVAERRIGA